MKQIITFALALAMLVPMFGQSAMAKSPKKAAAIKCPACGMPLTAAKTAMDTIPVKVNGKVYYCCAGCPMGSKAAAYFKKTHKPMVVTAASTKSKKSAKM